MKKDNPDILRLALLSINKIHDWICWLNLEGQIIYVNQIGYKTLGYTEEEIYKLTIFEIDLNYTRESWRTHFEKLKSIGSRTFETKHLKKDGSFLQVEISSNYIEFDGKAYNCAIVRNITDRKRSERREQIKNRVLDLVAHNAPLQETLGYLAHGVEEENPERQCSILLLDRTGQHLTNYVSPSLPLGYTEAIEGLEIGPEVGSCGTAAYIRQPVIVEDIQADPLWRNFKELAAKFKLASCWSMPIIVDSNIVVGTFAIYHQTPKVASSADIEQLEYLANLARIAIERHRAAEELKLSDSIFKNTSEGMLVTDKAGKIVTANPAFTKISGYSPDEVIGRHPAEFCSSKFTEEFYLSIKEELDKVGCWKGEVWGVKKSKEEYINWVSINTIYDEIGQPFRRVFIFSDITENKKNEELIWFEANYDALTQLPNRRLFQERLQQEIYRANRVGSKVVLLYLDLDGFKEVNDALGHQGGDRLLIEVAVRLKRVVRVTDCIARLGGDEFTITLTDIQDSLTSTKIATSILDILQIPFLIDTQSNYVTGSLGITVYPDDAQDVASLVKNADQAMYAAKQQGRNQYSFYTQEMQLTANKRSQQKRELRQALLNNEFEIHFQPIVDIKSNAVTKAEALLRWKHETLGMISPTEFIPLAEETALIHEIGSWVFCECIDQVRKWRNTVHPDFQISVNISPIQFKNPAYFDTWFKLLEGGANNNAICIEITEGVLLDALESTSNQLFRFRDAGIEVAIDDFGTGYSSLAYIKQIDVDYLKIDRSFISNMTMESNDYTLVEAIIMMAQKLGLKVVAEGVETEAQLNILRSIGCDYIQGYFIARPLALLEFNSWLESRVNLCSV